jgi:hypothetical protein
LSGWALEGLIMVVRFENVGSTGATGALLAVTGGP